MQPQASKPPLKPKFRSFLLSLLAHIHSTLDFPSLTPLEKTRLLQAHIQNSDNSIKALYSNYNYKSLITDICSEILFNLKEKQGLLSESERNSYFLSFFLDFNSMDISLDAGKNVVTLEKPKSSSNFLNLLGFLEEELILPANEIRTYIVQIAELPLQIITFLENTNFSEFILRDAEKNTIDLNKEFEVIDRFLDECLIDDELQWMVQLEKKAIFDKIFIGHVIKRKRLKVIEFFNKIIENGVIYKDDRLRERIMNRDFQINALKNINKDDFTGFVELCEMIKRLNNNNIDFIVGEMKPFIQNIRKNVDLIPMPIEAFAVKLLNLSIGENNIKYYDCFALIFKIYMNFLSKKDQNPSQNDNFFMDLFIKHANSMPFQIKMDFIRTFLENSQKIPITQSNLLLFNAFSTESPAKPQVQETFLSYLETLPRFPNEDQSLLVKNIIKILEFSSESLLLLTEKATRFLIEGLLKKEIFLGEILQLALKRNYPPTIRIIRELLLFERLLQSPIIDNPHLLGFILDQEALKKDPSLSFHCELLIMELDLLNGQKLGQKFEGLLGLFEFLLDLTTKNQGLKQQLLEKTKLFEKIITLFIKDWETNEDTTSLDLFGKGLRRSKEFRRLVEKVLKTDAQERFLKVLNRKEMEKLLEWCFNGDGNKLISSELLMFYLRSLKDQGDLKMKIAFLEFYRGFLVKAEYFNILVTTNFFQLIFESFRVEMSAYNPPEILPMFLDIIEKSIEKQGFLLDRREVGVLRVLHDLYILTNDKTVVELIMRLTTKSGFSSFGIEFPGPNIVVPTGLKNRDRGFSLLFWLRSDFGTNWEKSDFCQIGHELSLDLIKKNDMAYLNVKWRRMAISDDIELGSLENWTLIALVYDKSSRETKIFINETAKPILCRMTSETEPQLETLKFSSETCKIMLGTITAFDQSLSDLEIINIRLRIDSHGLFKLKNPGILYYHHYKTIFSPEKVLEPFDLPRPSLLLDFRNMKRLEKTKGFFLSQIKGPKPSDYELFFNENTAENNEIDCENDLGFSEKHGNAMYGILLLEPSYLPNTRKTKSPFRHHRSIQYLIAKSGYIRSLLISTDYRDLKLVLEAIGNSQMILKSWAQQNFLPLVCEKARELGLSELMVQTLTGIGLIQYPEKLIEWLVDCEGLERMSTEVRVSVLGNVLESLCRGKGFSQRNAEGLLRRDERIIEFLIVRLREHSELFDLNCRIIEEILKKSRLAPQRLGTTVHFAIVHGFQKHPNQIIMLNKVLECLFKNDLFHGLGMRENLAFFPKAYLGRIDKPGFSVFESVRECSELTPDEVVLIQFAVRLFWLELMWSNEDFSVFKTIRLLAPYSVNLDVLVWCFGQFKGRKFGNAQEFLRKLNVFLGFLVKALELSRLFEAKNIPKLKDFNEDTRVLQPDFAILQPVSSFELIRAFFYHEVQHFLSKALLDNKGVFKKSSHFEQFLGIATNLLKALTSIKALPTSNDSLNDLPLIIIKESEPICDKSNDLPPKLTQSFIEKPEDTPKIIITKTQSFMEKSDDTTAETKFTTHSPEDTTPNSQFLDFLVSNVIFYHELTGLDRRYLDKLLLVFEDVLRGDAQLPIIRRRLWLELKPKAYCDDKFLLRIASAAILQPESMLLWVIKEIAERLETVSRKDHPQHPKKQSFFEAILTKKPSFMGNSSILSTDIGRLCIAGQHCLVRLFEIKNKLDDHLCQFLESKIELFLLKSKESDKNLDFCICFIEFFWDALQNNPSLSKSSRESLIKTLAKALKPLPTSLLKKTLEFYDISAYEKGLDRLLNDKTTPLDFFVFINYQEVHCRLHMVITKKLKLQADSFSREVQRKAEQGMETPLVFTEELEFMEFISNRKSLDSTARIELFKDLGVKRIEKGDFLGIRPWAYFEEEGAEASEGGMEKSIAIIFGSQSNNKEDRHWDWVYAKSFAALNLILARKAARNLEKSEKALKSSRFALGLSGKLGTGYTRRLVFPKKVSPSISRERRFSWLSGSAVNLMQNSGIFMNKLLVRPPTIFAKTMDTTPEIEVYMSQKPKETSNFPKDKRLKSNEFKKFLAENAISDDILDYFPMALLKEREYFLEGLGLLGKDRLFFVFGYGLNSRKLPEKGLVSEGDKAKYLSRPAKKFPLRKTLSEGEQLFNAFPHSNKEDLPQKPAIVIPRTDIHELHAKRYWLKPCAIELFTRSKAYFLIVNLFKRTNVMRKLLNFLNVSLSTPAPLEKTVFLMTLDQNPAQALGSKVLKEAGRLWEQGLLSNFNYLMVLNLFAGRTFSDLAQYPVFPWVLTNYVKEQVDLLDPNNYRDFTKPVGALTEERAKIAREKYQNSKEENVCFPPFHYGSHYSSAVLVLYYLVRLMPFAKYAINLQGGKFDLSDRLFSSFPETWSLANSVDFKELIPDVFTVPEFLLNLNSFDFGETQNRERVDDVLLSLWSANEPRFFVEMIRKSLETPTVSEKLHHWIDLIFGYKQKGKPAVDSLNIFYFLTYEDGVQLENIEDPVERNAYLDQINEYGQTPKQLFQEPHPERKCMGINKAIFANGERLKILRKELIINKEVIGGGTASSFEFEDDWSQNQSFGIQSLLMDSYDSEPKMPEIRRKTPGNVKELKGKQMIFIGGKDGVIKVQSGKEVIKRLQGVHWSEILRIETFMGFGLMFSVDRLGILACWDLDTFKFCRKTVVFHFKDPRVIEKCLPNEEMSCYYREKTRKIAFCEQNGDFAVISKHYLSVYTINCVILALKRADDRKFTEVQLKRPLHSYEDEVIVTGDARGEIAFWILKLRTQEGRKNYSERRTKNPYAEHYRNNRVEKRGFELILVHRVRGDEEPGRVVSVAFNRDARKMWSLGENGTIFEWFSIIFYYFYNFRSFCRNYLMFFVDFLGGIEI